MQSPALTTAGSALAFCVSLVLGVGSASVVKDATTPKEPYTLSLVSLQYKDGQIGQEIYINGHTSIPAVWTTEISREHHVLCAGSGYAIYDVRPPKEIRWHSPDEWTSSNCPELHAGDKLEMTLQWTGIDGLRVVSSGTKSISQTDLIPSS